MRALALSATFRAKKISDIPKQFNLRVSETVQVAGPTRRPHRGYSPNDKKIWRFTRRRDPSRDLNPRDLISESPDHPEHPIS